MKEYVARRVMLMVPTLILVMLIVFSVVRLLPGDVVDLMLQENMSYENEAALREALGLSKPIYLQFLDWFGNLLRGDLGTSLWSNSKAIDEINPETEGRWACS